MTHSWSIFVAPNLLNRDFRIVVNKLVRLCQTSCWGRATALARKKWFSSPQKSQKMCAKVLKKLSTIVKKPVCWTWFNFLLYWGKSDFTGTRLSKEGCLTWVVQRLPERFEKVSIRLGPKRSPLGMHSDFQQAGCIQLKSLAFVQIGLREMPANKPENPQAKKKHHQKANTLLSKELLPPCAVPPGEHNVWSIMGTALWNGSNKTPLDVPIVT